MFHVAASAVFVSDATSLDSLHLGAGAQIDMTVVIVSPM